MPVESNVLFDSWLQRLKWTKILGCIHFALHGLEYTSITVTALYYFRDILHVIDPKLFYSLSMGAYYLCSSSFGTILGSLMDRTRDLRKLMLTTIFLSIVGNVLYTLPFSPWLPVIGRFLCGFSDAMQPVFCGEISRCLPIEEFKTFVETYVFYMMLFFALGPCTPFLFGGVHFNIGVWKITKYNAVNLLLAIILSFFLVVTYFILINPTKEPGYQIYLQREKQNKNEQKTKIESKSWKEEQTVKLLTYKDIFLSSNIATILFTCAYSSLLYGLIELILYMEAIQIYNWNVTKSTIITVFGAALYLLQMQFVFPKLTKGLHNLYYLYVVCVLLAWFNLLLLIFPTITVVPSPTLQIIILGLAIAISIQFCSINIVCTNVLLAALVPAHSASFAQGIKFSFYKLMMCIGCFGAVYVFPIIPTLFPILSGFCFVCVIMLLYKKNTMFP